MTPTENAKRLLKTLLLTILLMNIGAFTGAAAGYTLGTVASYTPLSRVILQTLNSAGIHAGNLTEFTTALGFLIGFIKINVSYSEEKKEVSL